MVKRRKFARLVTGVPAPAGTTDSAANEPGAAGSVRRWRNHFASLTDSALGARLTYLDSAATTQRPNAVLDADGIAIRAGDLSARPLLRRLGVQSAARASCFLYTTAAEIDRLAEGLEKITNR